MTAPLLLVISPDDVLAAALPRLGDPPVVELDGAVYELRTSRRVQAGEAHVVDPSRVPDLECAL